jgi:hypothetical protein
MSNDDLNNAWRRLALRDRVHVSPTATSANVSNAIHQVRDDRDVDQPGRPRVVKGEQPTVSDLLRQLRAGDFGDDRDTPDDGA